MIRHVVMFQWTSAATDEQKAAVADGLNALPALIPSIRAYTHGPDLGVNDGNYHYAIAADFDDLDGYLTYRDHPAHQSLIAERIAPIRGERAAAQFFVEP